MRKFDQHLSVEKLAFAFFVAFFVAFFIACIGSAHALHAQSASRSIMPADLDAYIENVRVQWKIPGLAIAVVRNDSTVLAKGYGVRRLGTPDRVDANTVFDIASLSKSFTATTAAILVDRAIMRWDDPVHKFLPELVLPDSLTDRATLRDFLSHRTGIDAANMMWVPTGVGSAEVLRRIQYLKTVAPFRSGMVYSNIGYTVAGAAMSAVARAPFENLLRDLVIRPLKLTSTTWTYAQAASLPNIAASHVTIDNRLQVIPRELQRAAIGPAAGVQSTATDMARWMRFQLNNGVMDGRRYVSDSAMREIHSVQARIPTTPAMRAARLVQDTVIGYAMGWQVMDYRGHRVIWHSGNGDGQIAYMALFPNEGLGIVVMVNTWSAPNIHGLLINRIADAFLGYDPRDWAGENISRMGAIDSARGVARIAMVAMRSSAPLPVAVAAYAGRYDHAVFGPIWIRLNGTALSFQMGEGRVADLEYHGDNTFAIVWRDAFFREYYPAHVTFTTNGDKVVSFTTLLNRDQFTATKSASSDR